MYAVTYLSSFLTAEVARTLGLNAILIFVRLEYRLRTTLINERELLGKRGDPAGEVSQEFDYVL